MTNPDQDGAGSLRDNTADRQYELATGGDVAIVAYRREGDRIALTHTLVPERLQGRGIGTRLVAGVLADIRRHGWRLVPQCPFVAAYLDRHPEERDLVDA